MAAPSDRSRKQELRQELLQTRGKLKNRERKDALIQEKILNSSLYQKARSVVVYVAKNEETATDRILRDAINHKQAFVPVTIQHPRPDRCELQISPVSSLQELRQGSFHISEPRQPDFKENLRLDIDPDLLLVPGVAFSEDKNRLGHGEGYFDRYLASLPTKSVKVGLAYEQQVVESLPVEDHDVPLDLIVTDERIIS